MAANNNDKAIKIMFVVAIVVVIIWWVVSRNKANQQGQQGEEEINLDTPNNSTGGGNNSSWYAAALAPLAFLNPLAALGIGGAALGTYFYNNSGSTGSNSVSNTSGGANPSVNPAQMIFPARKLTNPYMKGDDIVEMQRAYNRVVGYHKQRNLSPEWPTISPDGVFGPNTDKALKRMMNNATSHKLPDVVAKEKQIKTLLMIS